MVKFIKKITLYGFIFFVLLGVLNYRYEATKGWAYTDKFENVPEHLMLFNVGSSHGMCGFCYDELEISEESFNFGLNSQSLSYDYRILQQYKDKFGEDSICLISISYFALLSDEEIESNFEVKNSRYYNFLNPEYIKQYNITEDFCVRYFPVLSSQMGIWGILTSEKSYVNQFEIDWSRQTTAEETKDNAVAAVKRHVLDYEENGTWEVNEAELQALKDIITFCKEREITPVMIITPYLAEYNQSVPKEFKRYISTVVTDVAEEYDVQYYDYSEDVRFVERYDLFMNSDHLNKDGAKIFTEIVYDEIRNTDGE